VRIYLNTLLSQDPETWSALADVVKSLEQAGQRAEGTDTGHRV